MKIHFIVAQRRERYEGEHAPEVLESIDEFGNEENPEYLLNRLKAHRQDSSFESVEIAILEVSRKAIMQILRPTSIIQANIV